MYVEPSVTILLSYPCTFLEPRDYCGDSKSWVITEWWFRQHTLFVEFYISSVWPWGTSLLTQWMYFLETHFIWETLEGDWNGFYKDIQCIPLFLLVPVQGTELRRWRDKMTDCYEWIYVLYLPSRIVFVYNSTCSHSGKQKEFYQSCRLGSSWINSGTQFLKSPFKSVKSKVRVNQTQEIFPFFNPCSLNYLH